ncbi:hypothetical protein THRCLA_22152 [Thraustotheca clavata]|uniref:Uncharacterized protein n=1 Tax=Thraustotheca clavata TaxID=74557 RepID=A0A1V9ZBH5_9STRA|nr:hypothetical protein THRCLA_22152 [Thraustotheca clavata]
METTKRQRREEHEEVSSIIAMPKTSLCEMRAYGLQDKAEALSSTRETWCADMVKWRTQAFEQIDAKESTQHIRAQQRAYRRQMLQLSSK